MKGIDDDPPWAMALANDLAFCDDGRGRLERRLELWREKNQNFRLQEILWPDT